MSGKTLEDEPEFVNVVEKLKATKQLRPHPAFQRKSDWQSLEKLPEPENIFPIIDLVGDEDWLEYMRKLGFPETRLQEMYTSNSSEKKIHMLGEWLKLSGHFTATLSSILHRVTREISGSRDAHIDVLFGHLSGHVMITKGRDQAWFIYSLLDEYTDVDEWKEVVEKKLEIKATDVTEIQERFPNNFREQKYQIFHFFCRFNGLDTLDAMIAGAREKGLKVPPRFLYALRGTLDFTNPWIPEKDWEVLFSDFYMNLVEVEQSGQICLIRSDEGLSQHVDSLSVGSKGSSGDSGYSSRSFSNKFYETTDDSSRPTAIGQTRFVNVVGDFEAAQQFRHQSAFRSNLETLLEPENNRPIIDLVGDEDWLEFMRKLGFRETRLQEMYTSSSSEKSDMLDEWLKLAGHFTPALVNILHRVRHEISGSRDADVDRLFRRSSGYLNIGKGRDQAWFIYSLLDEYTDVDEWKEMVKKKLEIKATDVTEIQERFPNNFREQKYQIFHLFCRSNRLDTLDAVIAGIREKGLKAPPPSSSAQRGSLFPVLQLPRFSPSSSVFYENATERDLTEHGYTLSSADLFEKSADPLFVDETTMVVGPNGAVLKVGGCKIIIPEGALDVDTYICITSRYDRDAGENRATPLLKCEPHGLKFKKNVEVILPTCYLTDGSVSVTAKARRSEDGESWEIIKSFDYRIERCFKFSIKGFSWYDVILDTLFNLAVEKLIVCCVPHKYSDDPKRLVIVCNIFDAVLEHKQQNCTDLFKKSIALGSGESCVSFQLRNKHSSIEPEEREVRDARATKMEQVSFLLKKQQTDLLFQSVRLIVKAGDSETENEFFIINCNSEMEEKPGPSAKLRSAPSDDRPKVAGQSISGAVIGCEKVNYAPHYHHHHYSRDESAKQIAPPTREPIENGCIDGQTTVGALAGISNDAHEVLHGRSSQDA